MRKHFALAGALLLGSALASFAPGCGSDDSTFTPADAGDEVLVEAGPTWDSVDVEPKGAVLTVPLTGGATQAYKAIGTKNGQTADITAECSWSTDVAFGAFNGATFTSTARGGVTKVSASCSGASGDADLTLNLAGAIVGGGAPANAADIFKAAQLGTDAAKTPKLEYPLEGSILPLNLPAIDSQWTTAQNDLFHLSFVAPNLALDLYTKQADASFDDKVWQAVAATTAGNAVTVTVEGTLSATPTQRFASADVHMKMSHDKIDNTALYYWASSKKDLMTQTFGQVDAPTVVKDNCTSCHALSRTGSRIGYSRCVNNDCGTSYVGFTKFNSKTNAWTDTVNADTKSIDGSFTTFSPLGYPFQDDTKSLALVTRKAGNFELYDPDTGTVVASNVAAQSVKGPNNTTGRSALMPDWSPDGRTILFTSAPAAGQYIDVTAGALATMGYTYDYGNHVFANPTLILSQPVTLPSGTYDNFFFPSFSPDGALVLFNAARAKWRNTTDALQPGERLLLTDPKGSFVVDLANLNGPGEVGNTWPHWAPAATSDYLWIAFSTERPYGHKVTPATSPTAANNQGHIQYKQIWIAAIDKTKLPQAGQANPPDPSASPVWLPGQDLDADNISPYWTVPTTAIPK